MRKLRVFDGCTEFGSETKAFRDRGHEVITLGIEGDVDIKCDIRQYFPSIYDKYDFMTFHPPCTEFSTADSRKPPCKDRRPDLTIVDACFRIIETCKPIFWMVENPRGCLRHFIGEPQYKIYYNTFAHDTVKPTHLWGNIPPFAFITPKKATTDQRHIYGKDRAAKRALLPYNLSLALCEAIERCVL